MTTSEYFPPCWPNDADYLDGRTEVRVPPSTSLKAYWDTDVIDSNGVPPGTIIAVADAFTVRFRVELVGELWHCICGDWCFELKFTAIGDGTNFDLSDKLGQGEFEIKGWKGCDRRCIELVIVVPAGTIPAERCGTLYQVGATFALRCCDRDRPILVGYENLKEIEFY